MKNLNSIYHNGSPVILCDTEDIETSLRLAGIEVFDVHSDNLSSVLDNQQSVVMVISDPKLDRELLRKNIKEKDVLILPCYAFSSSTPDVIYSVVRLLEADLTETVHSLEKIVHRYRMGEEIIVKNEFADISTRIFDFKTMGLCKGGKIPLGGDVPVALFTEIGLVPNVTGNDFKDLGYRVDGSMMCHGVCVAKDRDCKENVHDLHSQAWSLFQTLRITNEMPLTLEISNNKVVRATTASGRDVISTISELMCQPFKTTILEFSIASNSNVIDNIDWGMNSVMNESAEGIHIGLGDGIHCPHIDLIMPSRNIQNHIYFNTLGA